MRDELASEFVEQCKITDEEMKILSLVWSTEPMKFFDLCNALRPHNLCPVKGDKAAWGKLFGTLGTLRQRNYLDYNKNKITHSLENLQLTKEGADLVREYADKQRGLLNSMYNFEDGNSYN